jgi:tripartite-type tricarboxylate transporter receptor subunit TctC
LTRQEAYDAIALNKAKKQIGETGMSFRNMALGLLGVAAVFSTAAPAQAQAKDDGFFKGRNVQVLIGYGVGGGYDLYGRLLARHMGRFVPGNPTMVPQNMVGAGSLKLANYLYSAAAPADGTAFGIVGSGVIFDPIFGGQGADYDSRKFKWIGSMQSFVQIAIAWHTSPVKSLADAQKNELVVGATGAGSGTNLYPKLLNALFNTKLKIVTGYQGTNEINLAIERGEVQGSVGWEWAGLVASKPDWLAEKKIVVWLQLALKKHPDIPDVPLVTDLAPTPDAKAILELGLASPLMGRPFIAPPGVPENRLQTLRTAFDAMLKDKAFLDEAAKAKLEIIPMTGQEIDALLQKAYASPPAIVEETAKALGYR